MNTKTRSRVEKVLDGIRPALRRDGGDIEVVEIKDNVVRVKLQGACAGCPLSQMTMKNLVETTIKRNVPEIERVETV
ncbi:MAG: NifU family protein [Candidatus Altiarchaeales archaeon]|nr:MAG: NifU family protein [Candidatus Altiarchaeales archaeon]RLI93964.1 MAG: NifU family protein [Candidatus Altiarchaeales archaeon]RLI95230.1 MAG: NifU family protein [Candidatus Altiarchaeales archaeon]HDO82652.1 NifU family protein [Candidatus Altiarchaeales archaeon]HEX55301.1 NifU family protein [Candidatus Altiarchaeales archaeon]